MSNIRWFLDLYFNFGGRRRKTLQSVTITFATSAEQHFVFRTTTQGTQFTPKGRNSDDHKRATRTPAMRRFMSRICTDTSEPGFMSWRGVRNWFPNKREGSCGSVQIWQDPNSVDPIVV